MGHTRRPTAALHWRCLLIENQRALGPRSRLLVPAASASVSCGAPAASNPGVLPSLAPTGYRIVCFWRRRTSSLHPGISKFRLESQIKSLGFDPPMNRPHYTVSAKQFFCAAGTLAKEFSLVFHRRRVMTVKYGGQHLIGRVLWDEGSRVILSRDA